jgi:hypothetical protein
MFLASFWDLLGESGRPKFLPLLGDALEFIPVARKICDVASERDSARRFFVGVAVNQLRLFEIDLTLAAA